MQKNLPLNSIRMDKTAFSVHYTDDESDEKQYWLSKSPFQPILLKCCAKFFKIFLNPCAAGMYREQRT